MRELTIEETEILRQRGYIPNSCVKISSNKREYVLVKNNNGKKLGARFLSSLKNIKKGEKSTMSSKSCNNSLNDIRSKTTSGNGSNKSSKIESNASKYNDTTDNVFLKEVN